MTSDVDPIPSPSPENLKRLAKALSELDARVLNPGSENLQIDGVQQATPRIARLDT